MRNHRMVFFLFGILMLFGIWALPKMNKDEFPQFTIRQGVVAAIYPGATAEEVEQQVTKPLEEFINSYSEVDKSNTYSVTNDGVVYVYVMLRNSVSSMGEAWAKMRAGLGLFKTTTLPPGVLQVVLIDDFGNTSSLLLAVESAQRSPRELEGYAKQLCSRLRTIPETGNLKIMGQQYEEIAVTIDPACLSSYNIDQTQLQASLLLQGFRTLSGTLPTSEALQVSIPYKSEQEIAEQIVWADPIDGSTIRLKDIATIERRYPHPDKYVEYYAYEENEETIEKSSCLIVNIEMVPGHNIVAFGNDVDRELALLKSELPPDIQFHRITDQPKVVNDSVMSFLRDILISIIVVIAVMLLLFPLRTALVASTGVPVCTAICIGLMYLTGIELNTVTLAALIFVLGMIVDDSVIVIDGYTNVLEKGHSRWYSATTSTRQLFLPMTIATCSISGMFFPMTKIITGPLGEFVRLFPFAVAFALGASIFYAAWVTPYLSTQFIRRMQPDEMNTFERLQTRFFSQLQKGYHHILSSCFKKSWVTYILLFGALGIGMYLMTVLNMQLLPKAEREVFAVEIHLREGSSIQETASVADSLAHILTKDKRIKSVTSFIGQASPRFHATYTPQMAASNYAQFIVNTTSSKATAAILKEYTPKCEDHFPNAYVRFKQMDYQAAKNPLEIYVQGDNWDGMQEVADTIKWYMKQQPELQWVHSDFDEYARRIAITLHTDEAFRLGVTETMLSLYLASVTEGAALTTIWENDVKVPVMLYTSGVDSMSIDHLRDLMVPTAYPGVWVPLRQVADCEPAWHHATLVHRNGIRTIAVGADLQGKTSQVAAEKKVKKWIRSQNLKREGVSISYGGLSSINGQMIPQILWSVVAALLVMFVLLLYHFGNVSLALLTLSSAALCIFGAFLGLWIFGLDISITAVLGIVSLIGIIVRNAIMMYEYAEELRKTRHLSTKDAAFEAGVRRMRPVFLTSATTALGVLPMIIAHTSLWMPMGVVICFGTIFTLPLTLTILPVMYWKIFTHKYD
ncbi:MAG: efflux RND transporter permease subunit [Paludibacteraceae bacterium]|nr:efflux RND transporter permease subunit [Paludibacteraceae bacterium]